MLARESWSLGIATDDPFFPLVLGVYTLTVVALAWLGTVISVRVVSNPIGQILLGLSVWLSLTLFASATLDAVALAGRDGQAMRDLSGWLGAWTFVPMVTISSVVILVLFPTGHLLSPRWRPILWLAAIGTVSWSVAEASRPNTRANRSVESLREPSIGGDFRHREHCSGRRLDRGRRQHCLALSEIAGR